MRWWTVLVKYHIVIDTIISKLFNLKTEKNRSTVTYPTVPFYRCSRWKYQESNLPFQKSRILHTHFGYIIWIRWWTVIVKYHIVIDTIISKLFNFKTEKNRCAVTYPTVPVYRCRSGNIKSPIYRFKVEYCKFISDTYIIWMMSGNIKIPIYRFKVEYCKFISDTSSGWWIVLLKFNIVIDTLVIGSRSPLKLIKETYFMYHISKFTYQIGKRRKEGKKGSVQYLSPE